MKNAIIVFLFILLVIGVVRWYQGQLAGSRPEGGSSIGVANPAAVACTDAGGTVEIVSAPSGGQVGICHTKDGRACEEWALYQRGACVSAP